MSMPGGAPDSRVVVRDRPVFRGRTPTQKRHRLTLGSSRAMVRRAQLPAVNSLRQEL
jgi:hypothetical protein